MKKLVALTIAILMLLCACTAQAEPAASQSPTPTPTPEITPTPSFDFVVVVDEPTDQPSPEPTTEPSPEPTPEATPEPTPHTHMESLGVIVRYKEQPVDVGCMLYKDGRLYLSRAEVEAATGKTSDGRENYLPELDGCICLTDVANQYGLEISITPQNNYVDLYDAKLPQAVGAKGDGEAYIRFEDVMANGLNADGSVNEDATYCDYNLEKLRTIGEYMQSRGQKFYIAWIPVYANPATGVTNNVIENQCLYNTDFIFTLDYLRALGGSIVLHGYTHQQFDTESAVGNEFGGDTEYTIEQMGQRMDSAIEMAKVLGYENNMFEFPHYAIIESSRALAEERFEVIYQYGPDVSAHIETTERDGKTTVYIPTPPDYVTSKYDTGVFDRLRYADSNDQLMSLFFHPTIDFEYSGVKTENGVRFGTYDVDNAFLPRIVDTIEELGYAFGHYGK